MAIIVEDGSNVPGANSYASVEDARDYATARGATLPADPAVEPLLINAVDYINTFRSRFAGTRTYPDQSMLFPRNGITIDCELFPKNKIPVELKNAQMQLVIYGTTTTLLPTVTGDEAFIKREKIGPIETEYSETIALETLNNGPSFPLVDSLLSVLFDNSGGRLRTVRI